jgi:LAO/AO transport system kinase
MASRGNPGGLSAATADAVDVLDAFGAEWIIVETVGAGQTEVDIVSVADAVCLVLTPEAGDSVQAMKAGLMEIADVFVVNKADRPGADRLLREIEAGRMEEEGPKSPIVKTVATRREGVNELRAAIGEHREKQQAGPGWEERRRTAARRRIVSIMEKTLRQEIRQGSRRPQLDAMTERVLRKEETPRRAARSLLEGRR